jgi:hypothetical protein
MAANDPAAEERRSVEERRSGIEERRSGMERRDAIAALVRTGLEYERGLEELRRAQDLAALRLRDFLHALRQANRSRRGHGRIAADALTNALSKAFPLG